MIDSIPKRTTLYVGTRPSQVRIFSKKPEGRKSEKSTSTNRVNTFVAPSDRVAGQETPTEGAKAAQRAAALKLKLRTQAEKLGLIPGSDAWRAYVLGTFSAMKKRKREKRTNDESGVVTPGK